MEIDPNGMRLNVARAYNQFIRSLKTNLAEEQINEIRGRAEDLRTAVGILLLAYDDKEFKMLANDIVLERF